MAISDHDKFADAKAVCDLLRARLAASLGPIERSESPTWCAIGQKPAFAWVKHFKRTKRIQVYLNCKIDERQSIESFASSLGVVLIWRENLESDWAKQSPCYVYLASIAEIEAALPLLIHLAQQTGRYPALTGVPSQVPGDFFEGSKVIAQVTRFERDPAARSLCLKLFGSICQVCGFDFEKTYGEIGAGFIHVHHLTPLATIRRKYKVDPQRDLRPLCANCHEMIHKRNPPFSIDELREIVNISRAALLA